MSLSESVRSELAAIDPRRPCCRLAELSALVRTAGTLHLRAGGSLAVHLDVGGAAVARRAFALLRGFGVAAEIRTYRRHAFGREARYELHLGDDPRALQTLNEAGVLGSALTPLTEPPRRVVARSCCRAAYLRGALLGAGSVTGPRSPHLELRAATETGARLLAALAAEEGIRLSVIDRGRHAAAYAKSSDAIADLLGLAGAHDAALAIGESAVVGATRAHANRLANADHANLVRASRAAQAELQAIRRLELRGDLERLPPELREIAELRLRHPSLSLRELASRCRPPATKASVHRRLKRLERLAGN
ncbi:MAG: DNA-binding protein WhiA [Thermoleophilia bacterium]|nr:DNA-binding protein WhiA [Thermoleophilia bacterium]